MYLFIIYACQIIPLNAYAQSPFSRALAFDTTLQKFKGYDEKFNYTISDSATGHSTDRVLFVYRLNDKIFIKNYMCSDSLLLEYPLLASDSKKLNRQCKIFFRRLFNYQVGFYDSKYIEKSPDKSYFDAIPKVQMWTVRAVRKYKLRRNNFVATGNISMYKYNTSRKYALKFIRDLQQFTQMITNYIEFKCPGGKLSP